LYAFLIFTMRATCPAHAILIDFIILIICRLLQPLATSFPLGTNIHFSTLFSNTLNLHSSLSARQVSQPYRKQVRL
jgi:hypothetical protein